MSVAASLFGKALSEELLEQFLCKLPVLLVDAVPYLGRFNGALYESCVLQFGEVLGNGGLGNGQFLVDVTEITLLLPGQELHNGDTCRMPQSLGETGQFLLPFSVFFLFFHISLLLVVRKTTNNI